MVVVEGNSDGASEGPNEEAGAGLNDGAWVMTEYPDKDMHALL